MRAFTSHVTSDFRVSAPPCFRDPILLILKSCPKVPPSDSADRPFNQRRATPASPRRLKARTTSSMRSRPRSLPFLARRPPPRPLTASAPLRRPWAAAALPTKRRTGVFLRAVHAFRLPSAAITRAFSVKR
jgi:hypothetical protein